MQLIAYFLFLYAFVLLLLLSTQGERERQGPYWALGFGKAAKALQHAATLMPPDIGIDIQEHRAFESVRKRW